MIKYAKINTTEGFSSLTFPVFLRAWETCKYSVLLIYVG